MASIDETIVSLTGLVGGPTGTDSLHLRRLQETWEIVDYERPISGALSLCLYVEIFDVEHGQILYRALNFSATRLSRFSTTLITFGKVAIQMRFRCPFLSFFSIDYSNNGIQSRFHTHQKVPNVPCHI